MDKPEMLQRLKESEKEYQITLTLNELEFIRRLLTGFDEFIEYINFFGDVAKIWVSGIDPGDLANKLFKQYYDENGELR